MSEDTAFDWGTHTVPDDRATELRFGPLELHFAREAGEIRIAVRRDGEGEELRWSRWAPGPDWDGTLSLLPAFPDRTLVVKPEDDFRLMRNAEARIFVRVPVEVRISVPGGERVPLLEVPTTVLSDTWWGSPEEGELCYFLDTRARRALADADFLEHVCACPLQLVNRSEDDLLVTHIALRPAFLSIYRDRERLWSDVTLVRYRGDEEGSSLEVSNRPPAEAAQPALLTPAATPMTRGFTARTFARLRSSLGGWI
ncbi:MAG: DUF432 domain-containing protein [Longimicrobiales bacterium]|nr:DUF432 domain-containing protein [Longimicrobiales bacterium]